MSAGNPEKRREARFPARIVAKIFRRNETIELLTHDVSFRGVFIRTDAPPRLRQLVKFELVLPSGIVVSGHAMVAHVAPTAAERLDGEVPVPGIGLQFWGAIANAKEWEQFIHQLRIRERAGIAAAKATDKIRRSSERFKLAIEIVLGGLVTMTRDVSETGMAIRTDAPMPVGTRVEMTLRAGEEIMTFDVIVRRAIQEPDFRGLGVEFVDLDLPTQAALIAFVRSHAPDEDVVLVPTSDVRLH